MRYHALACDYDGTIATHGIVPESTVAALERLRRSGRKLILLTGRRLEELMTVFPQAGLFDRIIAENGALLYRPAAREELVLAEPPPQTFVRALMDRGVDPVAAGRVIVATWEPHQTAVLETIHSLALELQVVFNKGAVMVLPSGVNKATGLHAALLELCLSVHNTAGVGDAENDHAFLNVCACSAAVANALDQIKKRADVVTVGDHGSGVEELIGMMIESDLEAVKPRHRIEVGTAMDGSAVTLPPLGRSVMVVGASGGGKSNLATAILERLIAHEYQFAIVDPEGDYEDLPGATEMGDARRIPDSEEAARVLRQPDQNLVVNLLGIEVEERPAFFQAFMAHLEELTSRTGRPHWLILDEAHHLLPASGAFALSHPRERTTLLVSAAPDGISPQVLSGIDVLIGVGESAPHLMRSIAASLNEQGKLPELPEIDQRTAIFWPRRPEGPPVLFRPTEPTFERRRHLRKYAEGELGEDRSFYFRGRKKKLNLRAHNLAMFVQIAKGVDDDTWKYHLRRGDYSAWFREAIKDDDLATEIATLEQRNELSENESRALVERAIRSRYAARL